MNPARNNIPPRTAKPESFAYVIIDKDSFKELIANFEGAIEGATGHKQEVGIRIDGFEGAFTSAEDIVSTLTVREWCNLTSIRVNFNDKERYKTRLTLQFGSYSFLRQGLRIEYGSANTDIERLAIKEKVELFMSDYRRGVWFDDRKTSSVVAALVASLFLFWFYASISDKTLGELSLWNHVSVVSFAWLFAFMGYLFTSWVHHKAVPHFETVDSSGMTRLKKTSRYLLAGITVIGLASSLLALIQWIAGRA